MSLGVGGGYKYTITSIRGHSAQQNVTAKDRYVKQANRTCKYNDQYIPYHDGQNGLRPLISQSKCFRCTHDHLMESSVLLSKNSSDKRKINGEL